MARYRNYPKHVPKINIPEEWAKELFKLNYQQLTLLIKQHIVFEGDIDKLVKKYRPIQNILYEPRSTILKLVGRQLEEHSTWWTRNIIGGHSSQSMFASDEFRKFLRKDKEMKRQVKLALENTPAINEIVKEANKKLKEINKFRIDMGCPYEPFPLYKKASYTSENFYDNKFNDDLLHSNLIYDSFYGESLGNTLATNLSHTKQAIYEIRKQVNKKERSAKLASYEDKSRNVGQSLMSSMKAKIRTPYYCPYCLKKTPKTKLHVDHINPVSNGGLSLKRNLIPVCSECNLSKSDLSLRGFCKMNGLDYASVCDRLEEEGKFI